MFRSYNSLCFLIYFQVNEPVFMLDCNNSLQIGGEDTNITFEDQQQINTFARKTARMQELQDEIDAKKVYKKAQHKKGAAFLGSFGIIFHGLRLWYSFIATFLPRSLSHTLFKLSIYFVLSLQKELQNLEDAGDELLMLEDETAPIPYPYFLFLKNTMLTVLVGSEVSLSHCEHSLSEPSLCHKGQVRMFSSSNVLIRACSKLRPGRLIYIFGKQWKLFSGKYVNEMIWSKFWTCLFDSAVSPMIQHTERPKLIIYLCYTYSIPTININHSTTLAQVFSKKAALLEKL